MFGNYTVTVAVGDGGIAGRALLGIGGRWNDNLGGIGVFYAMVALQSR